MTETIDVIVGQLNRLEGKVDKVQGDMTVVRENVAGLSSELRIKGGVWGLIGGAIPAVGAAIWMMLKGH